MELRPLSHRLLGRLGRHPPIPFCHRSIWTCPYRWTSTHPAFPTHGAPPAPQGRTLSSLMSRYLRSPVCPDTPPSSPTVDSNGADYQPCPQPSPPYHHHPCPSPTIPLLDTLPFSSFAAGKSQCLTEAFLCCGLPPPSPPRPLLLPLLSLLCERGAKRQVLAGGRILLPRCWTKTHPAAWHCLEVCGAEASGASGAYLLTRQPLLFWRQGPWGSWKQ